jgi:hypothetical protein
MHPSHRTPEGRFEPGQSGNPFGRPRGARNKTTLAVEAVLDDRAADFVNRIIDSAQHGSLPAMRMCLDRVFPPRRGRPVKIDLPPLKTPQDVEDAAGAIVADAACGDLTPHEAVEFFRVIDAYRRTIFGVAQMKRLAELEKLFAAQQRGGAGNTSEIQADRDVAPVRAGDDGEPGGEENTSEIQTAAEQVSEGEASRDENTSEIQGPAPSGPSDVAGTARRETDLENADEIRRRGTAAYWEGTDEPRTGERRNAKIQADTGKAPTPPPAPHGEEAAPGERTARLEG